MSPLPLLHAFSVFALFGLIWTIQLVHYPAFRDIELRRFPAFHDRHSRNITFIVLPLMLVEIVTSVLLVMEHRTALSLSLLVLAAANWLTTFLIFVPIHRTISRRPRPGDLDGLVNLNWIRTLTWTAAAAVTLYRSATW
ncbi:MAG: hypothetical protein Q7Q71_11365 [Verrucomicrobiota bacterium JB023]|nr:hypothetical protein [Verrucomicrobiota bacterium JB023]